MAAVLVPTLDPRIEMLVHQLGQAFDRRAWHGANLLAALRSLDGSAAVWRPGSGRHNIAELAVHAAYWKYRVFRQISDAAPRSFDLPGSNFFAREVAPSPIEWDADLRLLRDWHGRLLAAVVEFPPARLTETAGRNRFTYLEMISGAASHDLYHAGQIQLIRRIYQSRP